jgi:hypothetical protein
MPYRRTIELISIVIRQICLLIYIATAHIEIVWKLQWRQHLERPIVEDHTACDNGFQSHLNRAEDAYTSL